MRVFVTGATGFIGSAVCRDLQEAGHTVLGLARSDAGAEALAKAGVEVHRGDLTDPGSLVAGALACDGVIHLAFIHDFSQFAANAAADLAAVEAMVAALEGSGKPIVNTTGTLMLSFVKPATELIGPMSLEMPRAASEERVRTASGMRGSVVRLSPTVHGAGDHGFMPQLIAIARAKGFSAYIGDGANRWPAVHRLDAARLYRLALEKGEAGSRFHGAAEEGVAWRDIAAAIGAGTGLPVRAIAPEQASDHFGFLGGFAGMDNPTSSALTREALGWSPEQPELLPDLQGAGYFA